MIDLYIKEACRKLAEAEEKEIFRILSLDITFQRFIKRNYKIEVNPSKEEYSLINKRTKQIIGKWKKQVILEVKQ